MTDPKTAKQGGPIFFGWWVVVAATAVLTSQGVMFYGWGVLFPSILEEFQRSRAFTSSIYSVQLTTNSIFILLMGYLIDKYSPRVLIGVGAFLLTLGFVLGSTTRSIWYLYFYFGVVVAIGMSTMYLPPVTVVTRWFETRRGLALGIAVTGIGVGGFVGSPFLNWLIQSFGWRTAVLILGIVLGVFTFLAAMVLVGHPREKGLRPYGASPPEGIARDEPAGASGPHPRPSQPSAEPQWTVLRAVKTKAFLILYAMLLLAEIALMGVMTHLFTYATESGVPQEAVSWAYGVIGVASVAGKIGGGALSDRIGRKLTFLLSFAVKGTGILLLLAPPNVVLLYIFSIILGLSYGGWTPVFPAVVGDFFGARPMGRIYSVLTTTFLLGGICGPILAGRVFDRTGSYFAAFVFFSIICYAAAFLSLFVKPPATSAAN